MEWRDFPAEDYQEFVGKRIKSLEQSPKGDEGFLITFEDDTILHLYFSGCEGIICKGVAP
jgi:hypothetical protein